MRLPTTALMLIVTLLPSFFFLLNFALQRNAFNMQCIATLYRNAFNVQYRTFRLRGNLFKFQITFCSSLFMWVSSWCSALFKEWQRPTHPWQSTVMGRWWCRERCGQHIFQYVHAHTCMYKMQIPPDLHLNYRNSLALSAVWCCVCGGGAFCLGTGVCLVFP